MTNPDAIRSMIDSGASLRQLSSCFDRPLEAYEFFAREMQERFGLQAATVARKCALCGSREPHAARVDWRAITHSKATGAAAIVLLAFRHLTSLRIEIGLVTHHAVCPTCARRTRLRFAAAQVSKSALFACLLVTLLILVPLVVMTVGMMAFARDLVPRLALWSLGAMVLCCLVIWATRRVWVVGVPAPLRQIGRYPFEPVRLRRAEPVAAPNAAQPHR